MQVIQLKKSNFYSKLVDYYYDHVHWVVEPEPPSIRQWAKNEFGADIYQYQDLIEFSDPKDASFFLMRWS